jgi:hypothetical protein
VATGGGRCPQHADGDRLAELEQALAMAGRAVTRALGANVDRAALTDLVAAAWLDIRAQVWPDAAPAKPPRPRG